ncbi:hypothetical protein AM493_07935 [Flavobacterium akiainvivens]|uniref:YtxH domain-containing protein n=1 Tax=Flavobacterium akiainvivens TaxID=1202724 RepID=A0A0M8M8X9_9FLAO|nr:YtxH domain-containing protein [Flavobacterium akiainvivens]KOS05973.1 hypothetical protein AM493_07935 [Flavobacterium akiainvivens]SFQ53800.1 hypothetical protein SAMN05444144_10768 [Flavobacterium akiainvivens]
MSNKKLIIGIAAGVAALAVIGIIAKRKGYLDGAIEKAEEFGSNVKDKFNSAKEAARKKYDEVMHKGGEIAEKATSNGQATSNPATV